MVAAVLGVLLLLVLPYAADKETAVAQSREFDRFSPRMRLLGGGRPSSSTRAALEANAGGRRSRPLLSLAPDDRQNPQLPGGTMTPQVDSPRRPNRRGAAADAPSQTLREVARLRARRAARLSREQAAGRRRMLGAAALGAATVIVAVLAVLSAVGAGWVALPAVPLAASLILSRTAAVRSERARQAENEQMRVLRRRLRDQGGDRLGAGAANGAGGPRGEAAQGRGVRDGEGMPGDQGVPAGVPADAPAAAHAAPEGTAGATVVADLVADGAPVSEPREAGTAAPVVSSSPSGMGSCPATGADADPGPDRDAEATLAGPADRRTPPAEGPARAARSWAVPRVPAPSYAVRERVSGREVHADTDLRGIPQVQAAVPARPVAGSGSSAGARSTEQIVAAQPLAFDLEAVLDARRAE